ncbi:hypothetical protein CVT24_008232 [Panaeolus cyanescens]|uniref:Uncharacterized protein n=1 Tax=Panaeolus cyanescens TaxID=181874 RepID=A0A409YR36_9AGAR|nr:hypothetical protein CVT24_008232 [Panaeolus cyanescens]
MSNTSNTTIPIVQPGDDYPSTPTSDPGQPYTMPPDDSTDAQAATGTVDASSRDLYQYTTYKPSGTARVWAGRKTIYYWSGDEGMYACINRYLEAVNWVQLVSWNNTTAATQTYQISYTTSLTITEGSEINSGFNLGLSFFGISIGVDMSVKTFKSTETTSSQTTTITVNVPPNSLLVFYQKRYDFRDDTTFVNDAWGQEWNAGPWGGYTPLTTKTSRVRIMADEYFTSSSQLPAGPGTVQCNTVSQAQRAGTTRKRENLTGACKDKLNQMRL